MSVQDSTLKTRSATETRAINVQQGFDTFGAFQGAAWFLALTKLSHPMFNFFRANQRYFFLLTLCLYFASLIVYTVNFANAANKNVGKTANLAYRAFIFLFYLAIIAVALLIAPSLSSLMYFAFCVIDPLLNFIKSTYFLIKCLTVKTNEEKEFYFNKTMMAVKYAIGGAFFGIAMIFLFSVAGLPLALTATIGLLFMATSILLAPLIRPWVIKGIGKLIEFFKGKSEVPQPDNTNQISARSTSENESFYSHSILLKAMKPDALLNRITHLRTGLEFVCQPKENQHFFHKLFSEQAKRENKILVLTLLEELVSKLEKMPPSAIEQPFTLSDGKNKYDFYYSDKNQFSKKFHEHVLSHYPDAYQSWQKDIGRVHACVHQALDLVVSRPDEEARHGEERLLRRSNPVFA